MDDEHDVSEEMQESDDLHRVRAAIRLALVAEEAEEDEAAEEPNEVSSTQGRRGRPRINEQWTGVINTGSTDIEKYRPRILTTDLMLTPNLPGAAGKPLKNWQPLFFPKDFAKAKEKLELDSYRLSQDRMRQIGVQVTNLRARFRQQAE